MDALLDVERRRVDHEVRDVLLVLAAPHKLRVQVTVAPLVCQPYRVLLLLAHQRLVLGGGQVPACGLVVGEGLDGLGGLGSCASGQCNSLLQRLLGECDALVFGNPFESFVSGPQGSAGLGHDRSKQVCVNEADASAHE